MFVSGSPDGDVGDVLIKLESTPDEGPRMADVIPVTQGSGAFTKHAREAPGGVPPMR